MGLVKFLKFLKFKIRGKRIVQRVSAFDLVEEDDSAFPIQFSWNEIQRFTRNLSIAIGYGGFSTVYLAQEFQNSSNASAAVKIQCRSERLNQGHKQELEILRQINHQNIVKLIGFCDDQVEEGVLLLEYVPNGNLHEKLHGSKSRHTLSWKTQMCIVFQLASALDYIHNKCGLQIVHGDIKSSNILLDESLNCKLCDFGSAKMEFSSTLVPTSNGRKRMMTMMGSPGYTDPQYLRTGLTSVNNDIYSFGVVILELITGMEALNSHSGERLAIKALPMLRDFEKVIEMFDSSLQKDIDFEEAKAMVALSAMCICEASSLRPNASQIMATMTKEIPSISILFHKKEKLLCPQ